MGCLRFGANATTAAATLAVMGLGCGGSSTLDTRPDGGTGGGDGGTIHPHCIEPDGEFMAGYDPCMAATDEASCLDAGGSWGVFGALPVEQCSCSTDQEHCPCTRGSDCLSGHCLGTQESPIGCSDEGHCSAESVVLGCYCFLHGTGDEHYICRG